MSEPKTAIYRAWAEDETLLYVGISRSPLIRWTDHRKRKWWSQVHRIEALFLFSSRREALAAELRAIREENPVYNEAGRLPEDKAGTPLWRKLIRLEPRLKDVQSRAIADARNSPIAWVEPDGLRSEVERLVGWYRGSARKCAPAVECDISDLSSFGDIPDGPQMIDLWESERETNREWLWSPQAYSVACNAVYESIFR